ncbi:MAG: hypothetical protein LBM28_05315 [Oscillospiraceae bacterium]|jgi:hypothetical protein|nr:hypothetical protein [Oscillospiraceae bacterium]
MDYGIIGGLPFDTTQSSAMQILGYLFLLIITDAIAGVYATKMGARTDGFFLHRAGWARWVRHILRQACFYVLCWCALCGLLSILLLPRTVYAVGIFSVYAVFCAAVQTLLILTFRNAQAGLLPVIFLQLCSLYFSKALPGQWKLLLFGNWGSYLRTTFYGADGIAWFTALAIEVAGIAGIYVAGWRLIRYMNQKR